MSTVDVIDAPTALLDHGTPGWAPVASVNLMPAEILEGRSFRRVQRLLAGCVLAVSVAVIGVYAGARHDAGLAAEGLAAAQATSVTLRAEQARYAAVPQVYRAIDEAKAARESAMAQDVDWSRYLVGFSQTIPSNVWFTSLEMTLATAPGTGAAGGVGGAPGVTPGVTPGVAATSAGASEAPVAVVTVAGSARSHRDVTTWLDVLAREPALANPFLTSSANARVGTHDVVAFATTGSLGAAAATHRFDRTVP